MAYQDDGLSQFGYIMGREAFGGRRRDEERKRQQEEELKKLLQQLRPSAETTLTGQTQLGPVQQEPSFDIMGQVNQPKAPTMLSDQLTAQPWGQGPPEYNIPGPGYLTQPQPFEYDIPGPGYLSQPTPSRATFGAEALFPSGEPGPVEYPAGHPMHAYELDAQRRALQRQGGPRIPDMTMRGEPEPEYVGGATAQLPPEVVTPPAPRATAQLPPEIVNPPPLPAVERPPTVAGPDVVPEYLRRPDTTEAPQQPDTFVPGGQRVTRQVPGKELLDVVLANPQLLPILKANPGLLQLIQQEQERQQWNAVVQGAGIPGAAAPAVGVAPPVATGTAAAAGPTGAPTVGAPPATPEETQLAVATRRREQLQPIVDRINADPTGRVANSPSGKAYLDRYQKAVDDEQQAAAAVQTAAQSRVTVAKGTREAETAKREDKAREALEKSLREDQEPPTPEGAPSEGGPPVSPRVAALRQRRRQLDRPLQKLLEHPEFLGTEAGKDVLAQMKVVSGMLTEAETAEKTTTERVQDDARTALFTKFANQERARGNEAGAQIYEAAALDKDSAEIVFKHREEARKAALEGTGAAAWKPWSEAFGDEVAGELAATQGLTPGTVTSAHIRTARDNVNREKIARQTAGKTSIDIKWSPGQVDDLADSLNTVYNYRKIAADIRKHPEGWGGPGGVYAKLDKVWAKAGYGDEARTKARTDLGQSGSMLRKVIFGTALSAHEAKLAQWIPTGTEESVPELLAKLEATAENIDRAIRFKAYLARGGDPTKLPMMATPKGDVSLTEPEAKPTAPPPPTGKPAVGGKNPENPPGADGRTPRGQSARERLGLP